MQCERCGAEVVWVDGEGQCEACREIGREELRLLTKAFRMPNSAPCAICGGTRAGKLLAKGKPFVVVACDEPYYATVYALIREFERDNGRWTEEDENTYVACIVEKQRNMPAHERGITEALARAVSAALPCGARGGK